MNTGEHLKRHQKTVAERGPPHYVDIKYPDIISKNFVCYQNKHQDRWRRKLPNAEFRYNELTRESVMLIDLLNELVDEYNRICSDKERLNIRYTHHSRSDEMSGRLPCRGGGNIEMHRIKRPFQERDANGTLVDVYDIATCHRDAPNSNGCRYTISNTLNEQQIQIVGCPNNRIEVVYDEILKGTRKDVDAFNRNPNNIKFKNALKEVILPYNAFSHRYLRWRGERGSNGHNENI